MEAKVKFILVKLIYCNNANEQKCKITLSENVPFSYNYLPINSTYYNHLVENNKDFFTYQISTESYYSIIVTLRVISGNAKLNVELNNNVSEEKEYLLGNTIIKELNIEHLQLFLVDTVYVNIIADTNCYYSINFQKYHYKIEHSFPQNEVILSFLRGDYQKYHLNTKAQKYLSVFEPINCDISVEYNYINILPYITDFFQLEINNEKYKNEIIKISQKQLQDDDPLCLFYLSSSLEDSPILISEGVQTKIILGNNTKEVKYIFPITNSNSEIIINFDNINKELINVKIDIEKEEIHNYFINTKRIIFIDSNTITSICKELDICMIDISLSLPSTSVNEAIIITTITTKFSFPFVISKRKQLHHASLFNTPTYYMLLIKKGQAGYLNLGSKNGMPTIFGGVYEKNKKYNNEKYYGMLPLPTLDNNQFSYMNNYTGTYFNSNTSNCTELLSYIRSEYFYQTPSKDIFDYTIYYNNYNNDIADYVNVTLGEIIEGNLDIKDARQFLVYVPYDTDTLTIALICEVCQLKIHLRDSNEYIPFESEKKYNVFNILSTFPIFKNDTIKGKQLIDLSLINSSFIFYLVLFSFTIRANKKKYIQM